MSFSFVKFLNALVNPTDKDAQKRASNELESVTQGRMGGYVIPRQEVEQMPHNYVIPRQEMDNGKRDITTGSGSGGNLVQDEVQASDFVLSLLAQNFALPRAKIYTGLDGTVELPTESNSVSAGWVLETGAATEVSPTVGKITLKPKRLTAFVDVSHGLLVQGNPDVEDLLKEMLSRQVSNAIDNAILYGDGSGGAPTGIANLSGVNTDISLTSANSRRGDKVNEALAKAERNLTDNNVDEGKIEVLMSPHLYQSCRFKSWDGNATDTTTDSKIPILPERDSKLFGMYPVTKSGRASTGNGAFMGDWNQVVVGQFSNGFELTVNSYENDISGLVRITILSLADVQFEHATSFQQIVVA